MSLGDQKPSKETLVRSQSKDDHLHSKCDLVDEEEGRDIRQSTEMRNQEVRTDGICRGRRGCRDQVFGLSLDGGGCHLVRWGHRKEQLEEVTMSSRLY